MVNLMAAERRLQEAPRDGDVDAFDPCCVRVSWVRRPVLREVPGIRRLREASPPGGGRMRVCARHVGPGDDAFNTTATLSRCASVWV